MKLDNLKPVIQMGHDPIVDAAVARLKKVVAAPDMNSHLAQIIWFQGKWHKLHDNLKRRESQLRRIFGK